MRYSVMCSVFCLCFAAAVCGQTVFSFGIDTLYVSGGDSATVVMPRNTVFSAGDTVSVHSWYASDDSSSWQALRDCNYNFVTGDSICIDTLPLHVYYLAYLHAAGQATEYIVWKVGCAEFVKLNVPIVWNDCYIDRDDILLLRDDSMMLGYVFEGLQPDSVFWRRDGLKTSLPAKLKGTYDCAGYIYNRYGMAIDSVFSRVFSVDFVHPLHSIVFRSWRGSNDGRPRLTDTLVVDSCVREYVIDTLVFAVGDAYRYEFVPVIQAFDKVYDFTYKWEYESFAFVAQRDSVLVFDPIGFHHTGSYRFVTVWHPNPATAVRYNAAPVRVVAHNTGSLPPVPLPVEGGVIYDISGRVVKTGLYGLYTDVIRRVELPAGVYFLRDKKIVYKFIK